MVIELSAEQEAQLREIAAQRGKSAEELAREVLVRGLATEARFEEGVRRGIEAADRGDFVDEAEIRAGLEKIFRS